MLIPDHKIKSLCIKTPHRPMLIEPFVAEQVQPASYDLSLGRLWRFPGPNNDVFAAKGYLLQPGKLMLGCTGERLCLPYDLAGQIEGKSGFARRGLQIEAAGHVDPGYDGIITLELYNLADYPLQLEEGDLVAKVLFFRLESPSLVPYNPERNHHQYAHGPV